ncbi:peptide-methionine (S)-S-oxide reductase MsrA [Iodidimonas sp. SYSU 1G8]|uniref:peptide-methionine (S)-S-oxide reductase MsrA n=1 Tax=Iodidimonas sp. SYSU 1G8 TaxID=3133967 RepID=UPI0031FE70BD
MTQLETATLAGGCFWCTEAVFLPVRGVESVVSGYTDGQTANPTYQQICTGTTGHAEAVQVRFDPSVVSYDTLLDMFFATHDPTQLNRQGNDVGTQYRSAVYYHDDAQKAAAEAAAARAAEIWDGEIVTQIRPAVTFWPAEDYHQDFYANNPRQPYCMAVVAPKVLKARKLFAPLLRGD